MNTTINRLTDSLCREALSSEGAISLKRAAHRPELHRLHLQGKLKTLFV